MSYSSAELASRHCQPLKGAEHALSVGEIQSLHTALPHWALSDDGKALAISGHNKTTPSAHRLDGDGADRPSSGTHADRDASALEGRASRRAGADQPVTSPANQFAIGAQIH